jgi:hypothetical protein
LLESLRRTDGAGTQGDRLSRQARTAVKSGDYDTAEALLRRIDAEALAGLRRRQADVDRARLQAAVARAERAGVVELRFRNAEAGHLYREAADFLPEAHGQRRARYVGAGVRALDAAVLKEARGLAGRGEPVAALHVLEARFACAAGRDAGGTGDADLAALRLEAERLAVAADLPD